MLGILAVAGPLGFIAFVVFPVWILAVSIVLFRRGNATVRPESRPTAV